MSSPQEPKSAGIGKLSCDPAVAEIAAHYKQAYPRLIAVAAGVLGRREGSEDIVQDAAGIAVTKRQRFANTAEFVAWMIGVVRRCALNERRKTQRRRTFPTDPVTIQGVADRTPREPLPIDGSSGELAAGQVSFDDQLLAALEGLQADARCCLLLRTVHEMSYAEISALLGIPSGTAMSHVHRSRRYLRDRLGAAEAGGDRSSPKDLDFQNEPFRPV